MRVIGTTFPHAFSGEAEGIFEGLRARGLIDATLGGHMPLPWASFFLARTFRPNKYRWYCAWQHEMVKSPLAFRLRTRSLDGRLRRRLAEFDLVLQIGALFAPFRGENPKPVALFCDYTTKLAELNYPPWFNMNETTAREWYALETALYRRCAILLTASENTRSSLVEHYGISPSRVRVVGLGTDAVYEHPGKTYDESTILFIGIDFDRKGGAALLEAFGEVRQRLPEARLFVVGPRPREPQSGVAWLGHVTGRTRVCELLSRATVLALPSICEPYGFPLIEAMSHGLPVVGSRADAMPEIVQEGVTGYLVKPGDAHALADRLIRLMSSPGLCAKMGSAGRARVAANFLWKHVADRIESGLREVCRSRASQGA